MRRASCYWTFICVSHFEENMSPDVVSEPLLTSAYVAFDGLASSDQNNNPERFSRNVTSKAKRIILKNGNVNSTPENIDRRWAFLRDIITTMIDIKWRWNLLVFLLGFFGSWFVFAMLWWGIAFVHHDLENVDNPQWKPCIANLGSFQSALLFSIESQHTIGYGFRYITDECPDAFMLLCLQSITGVIIQSFVVGFVFAKLTRPQRRSQTLMFSKNAIIGHRNGVLCLSFRVGDIRTRSNIIGARISAVFVGRKYTNNGQDPISYFHETLSLSFDGMGNDLFLVWPAVISHVIDAKSPLQPMTHSKMSNELFEIVVLLEGTIESTGQLVQARTSYLASEILWNYDFEKMVKYCRESGVFMVDYSKFNSVKQVTSV